MKLKDKKYKPTIVNGERQIKAEAILNAWRNYCRTSFIYRILERIGLR
tara:strand:- start:215 stop:358 length:144 start_codon:yes stop_codon:yes gene_type:complete